MSQYMLRALELATLGRGHVSPNPMVGCVIVHENRIIGEGWHQRYGEAHAERNAILSVQPEDRYLLPESIVYVTLEPCSHYGKQPPCADLLIENRLKHVICCNNDPNPVVSGQGFARLRESGIAVETGLLAERGRQLNARFFTFFEKKRPYIVLKWAETTDGFVSGVGGKPVQISGPLAQRLVHKWRGEEDAIMVGTNTARLDNPRLNTRLWTGKNPTRIVFDKNLSLPPDLHLLDGTQSTIVLHQVESGPEIPAIMHSGSAFGFAKSLAHSLEILHEQRIQSILVEGGTTLLNSFLDEGLWDEMRVLRSPMMLNLETSSGAVKAPTVRGRLVGRDMIGDDELSIYRL